jgi:hypothetical protein
MEMTTTQRDVASEVSVWAIPEKDWVDGEWKMTGKWEYSLQTGSVYTKGAVKLYTQKVTLTVPEGIDMLNKAIDTIREEITSIRAETHKEIAELEATITQLLMLTHQKE